MPEIDAEIRKWGNSLGIVIPADVVKAHDLHPKDRVRVRLFKVRYPRPGSFGSLKDLRIDAQALKDELREAHDR